MTKKRKNEKKTDFANKSKKKALRKPSPTKGRKWTGFEGQDAPDEDYGRGQREIQLPSKLEDHLLEEGTQAALPKKKIEYSLMVPQPEPADLDPCAFL